MNSPIEFVKEFLPRAVIVLAVLGIGVAEAPRTAGQVPSVNNSLLRLDRPKYRPQPAGDCLQVTVRDPDQNHSPTVVESVAVSVLDGYPVGSATGDRADLTLVETGPDTGVFHTGACLPIHL